MTVRPEKIVYFDMDNTMVDFDGAALRTLPKEMHVPRQAFYVADDYSEEQKLLIQAVYNDPDFFDNLELFPGVLETWSTLLEHGYHPQILSAPLTSNPRSVEGKKESIRRHLVPAFGRRVLDEAIFDKEKWGHNGLILNDDRPDLPRGPNGSNVASWEHVLYGWPHLKVVPLAQTSFRLLDYSDPEALLEVARKIEFERSAGV